MPCDWVADFNKGEIVEHLDPGPVGGRWEYSEVRLHDPGAEIALVLDDAVIGRIPTASILQPAPPSP